MSKSLKRVERHIKDAGLDIEVLHVTVSTKTAAEAAAVVGSHVDQIAKSIIFLGETSGRAILFLTAGGNRVSADRASALAGEPLGKADAALIRAQTGFAIGGVSPIGHLSAIATFMDPRLMEFETIWAAAGTPHHLFAIDPKVLHKLTGAQIASFTE